MSPHGPSCRRASTRLLSGLRSCCCRWRHSLVCRGRDRVGIAAGVCDRRDGVAARRHGGEVRGALSLPVAALLYLRRRAYRPDRGGADRRRGADGAADPAAAGRSSAGAAGGRRVQDLVRPSAADLGFRRQAHRRAAAARLGSRFVALDTRRQGADPARPGTAAAAPARRGAAGLARTGTARRRAVRAAARLAVAAPRGGAVAAPLCRGRRRQPCRRLGGHVGRLGSVAGMVDRDAEPGGVRDHRDGARRC